MTRYEIINENGKAVSKISASSSMNTIYNRYNKYCKRVLGEKAKFVMDDKVLGYGYWADEEGHKRILRKII